MHEPLIQKLMLFYVKTNQLNSVFISELINGYDIDKAQSYIEDCIAKHEPLLTVLRLICLQSLCGNGLKQKLLDYYKTEIIQVNLGMGCLRTIT